MLATRLLTQVKSDISVSRRCAFSKSCMFSRLEVACDTKVASSWRTRGPNAPLARDSSASETEGRSRVTRATVSALRYPASSRRTHPASRSFTSFIHRGARTACSRAFAARPASSGSSPAVSSEGGVHKE